MEANGNWSAYASPSAVTRRYLLSCRGAGEQSVDVPSFRQRSLPLHGLVYISAGSGTYREQSHPDSERAVQAPAVIWLFPGAEHSYGPGPEGWTEHWALFAGEAFAAFERAGLSARHEPVVPLAHPMPEATKLFDALRSALGTVGARSEIAASVALQEILLALLDAEDDPDRAASRSIALTLVAREAAIPMSVTARARRAGISVRELRGMVRAETGLHLNDFVLQVRISKAQSLLAETELDVRLIAERVGYGDAAYFSRVFGQRVGVSPTAFRSQQARKSTK